MSFALSSHRYASRPEVSSKKPGTSFRLSEQAIRHVDELAESFGLSKNSLMAMLILRLAKFDDILTNPGLRKDALKARDRGTLAQLSVRLTPNVKRVLETQSAAAGMSQTEAVEMVILDAARREHLA